MIILEKETDYRYVNFRLVVGQVLDWELLKKPSWNECEASERQGINDTALQETAGRITYFEYKRAIQAITEATKRYYAPGYFTEIKELLEKIKDLTKGHIGKNLSPAEQIAARVVDKVSLTLSDDSESMERAAAPSTCMKRDLAIAPKGRDTASDDTLIGKRGFGTLCPTG